MTGGVVRATKLGHHPTDAGDHRGGCDRMACVRHRRHHDSSRHHVTRMVAAAAVRLRRSCTRMSRYGVGTPSAG